MIKVVNIFLLAATGFVCFWLYQVKEDASEVKQQIVALKKQIVNEQRAINLLTAEWSYLNQPARLQALVERHGKRLNLGVMKLEQIVTFDRLKNRLSKPEQLDRKGLEGLAGLVDKNVR